MINEAMGECPECGESFQPNFNHVIGWAVCDDCWGWYILIKDD